MTFLARARGLLPRGTLVVGAGLAVLGAASYVHLAVAGHSLSTPGMASMSVLWSLVFLLGLGLFFPVEQELIRLVASRHATGEGIAPVVARGALLAAGILLATLIPLAALAGPLAGRLFGGDTGMVGALAGALAALAVVSVARGVLAGSGRFAAYGAQLASDGLLRVATAVALGITGAHSPVMFALVLTVAPLGSAAVTARPLWRELRPGPPIAWRRLCRGLGLLIGSSLLAQVVVNVAVINARLLSPGNVAVVAALLAAMILARVPLFIFASLQASLLPGLASAVAVDQLARFRGLLLRASAVVAGLGLAGGAAAVIAGPRLIQVLFAAHPVLGPADFAWLASGTLLYMLAMVLGQGAMALARHRDQLIAWAVGAAVLALVTMAPGGVKVRVEAAYALSSLAVCLGLILVLWLRGTDAARQDAVGRGAALPDPMPAGPPR